MRATTSRGECVRHFRRGATDGRSTHLGSGPVLEVLEAAGGELERRKLERVADLATNIAEDVVFATSGRLIRHNRLSKEELDKLG